MTQKEDFQTKGLPTANHQSPDLAGGSFSKQSVERTDQLLEGKAWGNLSAPTQEI